MKIKPKLRKFLSVLLSAIIILSAITIVPIPASAATQAESVIEIAKKQVGQYDRPNKFSNYLGIGTGPWCAAFAVWCAHTAGVSTDVVPSIASSTSLLVWYNQRGRWHRKNSKSWSYGGKSDNSSVDSSYIPQIGDLILLETNGVYSDGPDHTGLVAGYSNGTVYTVEGNVSGDKVKEYSYSATNSNIWGYCNPAYSGSQAPNPDIDNNNPDNYPVPTRDIYYTSPVMTGTDVMWVQAVLKKLGYSISVDGSFGPSSKAVVQQFQSDHGLNADGSVGPTTRQALIDAWNNKKGNNPTGAVDSITGGTGTVTICGWAFDKDDINAQLNIHVYIGGSLGDSNAEGTGAVWADAYRPDVNNAYRCGDYHGYEATIPTTKIGTQPVYIYAINVGGGETILLGSGTVNIMADTEKPIIEDSYISQVTTDSYRVCIIPKDNVGIKSVRVATWTQSNQSDLIWHNAMSNGLGTYFVDLNRSDYSGTNNSFYYNHAYVYDYAGNYTFVEINKDYRITSDTGITVNDGEYRLVTSADENKALDVDRAGTANGTNIQIYSNIDDPLQTFDVKYIGNGFYTIFSHNSQKTLDVNGDTYKPGTNVVISDYHNGSNQQWIVKPTDDGYFNIIARSNGLALDLADAQSADGTNVQVNTVNNTISQKWKLRRVLKDNMITVQDVTITGNEDEIKPEITVVADEKVLTEGIDYSAKLSTDIKNGKGIVTIIGLGDYCDTITMPFKINEMTGDTEPSTEATEENTVGDVNGDGKVSVADATLILQSDVNFITLTSEQLAVADVNKDGAVNVKDATYIQMLEVKLISSFDEIAERTQ